MNTDDLELKSVDELGEIVTRVTEEIFRRGYALHMIWEHDAARCMIVVPEEAHG